MTIAILAVLFVGVIVGTVLASAIDLATADFAVTAGLAVLLFLVGIDLGRNKKLLQYMRTMGSRVIAVPVAIGVGSIAGAWVAGLPLGMAGHESAAVGAGFGWYSLSGVILAEFDTQLGATAFLCNVIRELIAIVCIPFLAVRLGHLYTLAPAGATAMDTTLPIVTKATSTEMAVMSFISGAVLSTAVPFLVPVIYGLG